MMSDDPLKHFTPLSLGGGYGGEAGEGGEASYSFFLVSSDANSKTIK